MFSVVVILLGLGIPLLSLLVVEIFRDCVVRRLLMKAVLHPFLEFAGGVEDQVGASALQFSLGTKPR